MQNLRAQVAGEAVFPFLKLDPSARSAALGGPVISIKDVDLSTALMNPAVVNVAHHNNFSLNYNNYFSDINYVHSSYARKFGTSPKSWVYSTQILYLDYGTFEGYDPFGNETGDFTASDMMIGFSASKPINNKLSFGGSLKFIYSTLETYVSTGVGADIGTFYHDSAKNLSMGFVLRNLGFQMISYRGTERAPLPFDINYAISHKPKHAPFRVSLLLHNLQKFDISNGYTDPLNRKIDENNQVIENKLNIAEKSLRHLTVGTELILSENFNVRLSYNHNRRQELGTAVRKGVAGFAWGFSFKIKKIRIEYGSAGFFPGYNSNLFSVNVNLNEFYR